MFTRQIPNDNWKDAQLGKFNIDADCRYDVNDVNEVGRSCLFMAVAGLAMRRASV